MTDHGEQSFRPSAEVTGSRPRRPTRRQRLHRQDHQAPPRGAAAGEPRGGLRGAGSHEVRVGLVTLPGAFVGVLIGSGNPVQAAAAQLLVLIGLLAAETVAVAVVLELIARGLIRRSVPVAI